MVSNIGRNVAPDPWTDFGSSGSKAQDAAWINSSAIDMTQYDTLILELEPGDAIAAGDIEVTITGPGGASSTSTTEVCWASGDESGEAIRAFLNESSPRALADGVKVLWSFGGSSPQGLLGMDAIYIHLTNKNASAKEMDGIRYRRAGFHPAG